MFSNFYKDSYYNYIPEADYRGRQRYILFVALSVVACICGMVFFIQSTIIFKERGWISYTMPILSILAIVNYFVFKRHKNTNVAYSIIVLACFMVLHFTTYVFGGLFSSSNFYLSVLTISSFVLLGIRAGWIFIMLGSIHMGVLYYLTTNTHFIKQVMGNIPGAMETDLLTSMIISLAVIGFHCISIERSNERLLKEMAESHKSIETYTHSVEKTNRELDSFAYIVSHDLKAPLRAINSLTSWIEDDLGDTLNDNAKANFVLLRNRVGRMEGLINGVLDYSRVARNNTTSERLDVRELIEDVVFLLAPPATVKIIISGQMPVIVSDKVKLQQVFSNLIGNAIKYNDKNEGIIKVTCNQLLHDWKFTIADNGPGIEPQYHSKVFDIFQTLQSKDKVESTGVGLAIVKKIIEDNMGDIYIESNELGGASFIFTLPKRLSEDNLDLELKLKTA